MSAPDFQTFWFQGSGGGTGAKGDMWITVVRNQNNNPADWGEGNSTAPGDLSFYTNNGYNLLDKDDNIYLLGTKQSEPFGVSNWMAAMPYYIKFDPNCKVLNQISFDSSEFTNYPYPGPRKATVTPDGEIWFTFVDYKGTGGNSAADYNLGWGKLNTDFTDGGQGTFTFGDGYWSPTWFQTRPNPINPRGWELIMCGRSQQAGPGLALKFNIETMGALESPGTWPQAYNTGTESACVNDAGYTAYTFSGYLSPHPNTPATPSPNFMISTPDNTGTATKISSWTGNQLTNAYYKAPAPWGDQGFYYFCGKRESGQESQAPNSSLQPNTLIRCTNTDALPAAQANFKSSEPLYNGVNNDYNVFNRTPFKRNPVTGEYWLVWSNSLTTIDIVKLDPFNFQVLDQKIIRGIEVDGLLTMIRDSNPASDVNTTQNRYGGQVIFDFNSTGEYIILSFSTSKIGGNTLGIYGPDTGKKQQKWIIMKVPCDFEKMTGTCAEVGLQWEDTDYYSFDAPGSGVFYNNQSALNGDLTQGGTSTNQGYAYWDDFVDNGPEPEPPFIYQQSYYYKG